MLLLPKVTSRVAAADIAANLVEPCMHARGSIQPIQVCPRLQQRLLHDVLDGVAGNTTQARQATQARACRCHPTSAVAQALTLEAARKRFPSGICLNYDVALLWHG